MRTLMFSLIVLAVIVACLLVQSEGVVIASFKKSLTEDQKGTLEIYFAALRDSALANLPMFPVTIAGNQGVGKSTTENALALALGIKGDLFKSANSMGHCTVDVHMSAPSPEGIVEVDQPGQQKGKLQAGLNLHSSNVDLMLAQTVIPFSNVLLHMCADSINDSDLQMLSLYSDERMHTGELSSVQAGNKPDLIVVLKSSRALELNEGEPISEEQYLASVIPANSPLRKTFNSIKLVLMPAVEGPDKELLREKTFHPEKIPKYWAAIQTLKTMIQGMAAKVPTSARWTGSEIATTLEQMLPSINANAKIDIPTMRSALLLNKVKAAVVTAKPLLVAQFDQHVRDPFHKDLVGKLLPDLTTARAAAEESLLKQFRGHESEATVWPQIKTAIAAAFDSITTEILNGVEEKKGTILTKELDAYEVARVASSKARTSMSFDGVSATVDQTLVNQLRAAVAAFQKAAVLPNVAPSPGYMDKLQRLRDDSVALWKSAHDANYAVYLNKRNVMRTKPIPAVSVEVHEHIDSCGNDHHERNFDLSQRFPQYFAPAKREELLSVSASFHGSGGGSGALNLNPGAGHHLVSTGGMGGKKHTGNIVYYNHANTVLHVVVDGGGWGGGNCNNRLQMSKVVLSITCNQLALAENAAFKQEYKKDAAEPVF